MKKQQKTNATRILDRLNYGYEMLFYDYSDGEITGTDVAVKINRPVEVVFKTLVTHSERDLIVFVIPVACELDLKKAAIAACKKKLEMFPMKDLQKATGYIRGGCSPVGMKKEFPTFIEESAIQLDKIVVSAGKVGVQMEINPQLLATSIGADFQELI